MVYQRVFRNLPILRNRFSLALAMAMSLSVNPALMLGTFADTSDEPPPQLQSMTPKLDASEPTPPAVSDTTTATTDSAPPTVASLMQKGVALTNKRKWSEASDVFKQVLGMEPNNVNAYYNLGAIAESTGDLEQALNFYKGAQSLAPGDTQISEAVASLSKTLGRPEMPSSPVGQQTQYTASYPGSSTSGSSSSSVPGAPYGYTPSPSYYGAATPPVSVSSNDPNFVQWQQQMKREHRREVEAKVARAAVVVGFVGLMIGLAFV